MGRNETKHWRCWQRLLLLQPLDVIRAHVVETNWNSIWQFKSSIWQNKYENVALPPTEPVWTSYFGCASAIWHCSCGYFFWGGIFGSPSTWTLNWHIQIIWILKILRSNQPSTVFVWRCPPCIKGPKQKANAMDQLLHWEKSHAILLETWKPRGIREVQLLVARFRHVSSTCRVKLWNGWGGWSKWLFLWWAYKW